MEYNLIVKDHPAKWGNRKLNDYRELMECPNIVFLHPDINSSDIIEKVDIVICIYGSVILETIAKGKQCIQLGKHFYNQSSNVHYVNSLSSLLNKIKQCSNEEIKPDFSFIKMLYSASFEGNASFFNGAGVSNNSHIEKLRSSFYQIFKQIN